MASVEKSECDELTHARYVENYLDCLENLPGDLQILLSRMLELDACFQKYDRQLDEQREVLLRDNVDAAARDKAFSKMRRSLARMHDIGDDKLQLVQSIHELIEKKARQLDIDFKNLRPKIEQENNEPVNGTTPKETVTSSNQSVKNVSTTPVNNEKVTRRGRRTRTETLTEPPDSSVLSENQSSNLPSTSNSSQKKANSVSNSGRKKKRKVAAQQNQSRDDSPSDDPDEPLYCICNQISYGKMILCDNDSCSLEWFHFNCVSLTTKPKGKWYCPQCRGSKPNIMKSKAQFR